MRIPLRSPTASRASRPLAAFPAPHASIGERIIRLERGWFNDFAWADGKVVVRKTGATTPLDATVLRHVFTWLCYFVVVRTVGAAKRLFRRPGPNIWFSPATPRPWYMIRSVAAFAGIRVVADPAEADLAFHFDDSTWSPAAAPFSGRTVNYACRDISKGLVNTLFLQVFGYALGVDPAEWTGDAVEKAEANSMHDGRVIVCPTRALPGRCYQRLVRTSANGKVTDLRTACVEGQPVVTWVKTRYEGDRFASGANLAVESLDPGDVFAPDELVLIARFNAAIGLQWGTLDILRDFTDGRIYIVDVNKTDVGPVLQLSMRDKIASTGTLARAFLALAAQPSGGLSETAIGDEDLL